MSQTKMFRDRVVNLEQTFELGEKYLPVLTELLAEAFPGFETTEHELSHEKDLFVLLLVNPESHETRRVLFTRMVLSDPGCIPALAETPRIPARDRLLECIRRQGPSAEIEVTFRAVMDEEDRVEAEQVDAEWRKKNEALEAARRVEEERRAAEKKRQRQIEEARRQQKQRGREGQKRTEGRAPQPVASPQQPQQRQPGERRNRSKRNRGGANAGGSQQPGQPGQAGQAMRPEGPRRMGEPGSGAEARPANRPPRIPNPPRPPQQDRPQAVVADRTSGTEGAPTEGANPGAPRSEGARRRRRRGRGGRGGGPRPSGQGPAPAPAGGGTAP